MNKLEILEITQQLFICEQLQSIECLAAVAGNSSALEAFYSKYPDNTIVKALNLQLCPNCGSEDMYDEQVPLRACLPGANLIFRYCRKCSALYAKKLETHS